MPSMYHHFSTFKFKLSVLVTGMFEIAVWPVGTDTATSQVALRAGSSHIGASRRASAGSICVASIRCGPVGPS